MSEAPAARGVNWGEFATTAAIAATIVVAMMAVPHLVPRARQALAQFRSHTTRSE